VELVPSAEPARWATERMRDTPEFSLWTFMPSGFERYIRVLHPLADRGGDRSFRWADFARADALPIAPDAQLRDVVGHEVMDQKWLDDLGPRDGSMSERTCSRLVELLRRFTSTPQTCWMAVWDGWGGWWPPITVTHEAAERLGTRSRIRAEGFRRAWAQSEKVRQAIAGIERVERPWGRQYFLFRGPIERAWSFHGQTPQLWWPEDRSWFVSTEIDGFSTYVGCDPACGDELMSSPRLETVDVELGTRLDTGY
jgi:hypothetical protein